MGEVRMSVRLLELRGKSVIEDFGMHQHLIHGCRTSAISGTVG